MTKQPWLRTLILAVGICASGCVMEVDPEGSPGGSNGDDQSWAACDIDSDCPQGESCAPTGELYGDASGTCMPK